MAAEFTERVEAAVLIALPAPEAPIEPEVRSTVEAVSVPEVSVIAPPAFKLIVLAPATVTPPATAILPPPVVARLNVSPLPA